MDAQQDAASSARALVSAVITTHHRPELLRRALASVRSEEYPWLEIAVVEDGHDLQEEDVAGEPPAVLIHVEAGGCAPARNAGLEKARGRYVIFLDDDDRALPNRISDLVESAEAGRHSICYGRTMKRTSVGAAIAIPLWPHSDSPVGFPELIVHMPHIDSVLLRCDALRSAGGMDEETPNFDELTAWLRILDSGGTALFRDCVVAEWNAHEEGLSGAISRDRTMKSSLITMLQAAAGFARSSNRECVQAILERVNAADIQSFDDYVAAAEGALHAAAAGKA